MIQYPGFQFASAPRTGTSWFVQACAIVGLGERTRGNVHIPHETVPQLRVSLVRHPCSWLLSYYCNIHRGWIGVPAVDVFNPFRYQSFDEFVVDYLKKAPGCIGRMMATYNATSWYKTEDLDNSFYDLLTTLEHKCTRTMLDHVSAIGKANKTRVRSPAWNRQLYNEVCKAEAHYMDQFDYFA